MIEHQTVSGRFRDPLAQCLVAGATGEECTEVGLQSFAVGRGRRGAAR